MWRDHVAVRKLCAGAAFAVSNSAIAVAPQAHAQGYCEFGNPLVPQEVHHVGTYSDATRAMVTDLVLTTVDSDCATVVADYVVSRRLLPRSAAARSTFLLLRSKSQLCTFRDLDMESVERHC